MDYNPSSHVGLWPDHVGTEHSMFAIGVIADMPQCRGPARSMNCFKQKNSSDTAFTNSDAGANGASDAAGNNMARRTVHGWQLCSDAKVLSDCPAANPPLPTRTPAASAATGDAEPLGDRSNEWYSESAFGTADNVRWPGVTVMSTLLSYAAPTAIIFYALPEFI